MSEVPLYLLFLMSEVPLYLPEAVRLACRFSSKRA
jgi:hypothetical protein